MFFQTFYVPYGYFPSLTSDAPQFLIPNQAVLLQPQVMTPQSSFLDNIPSLMDSPQSEEPQYPLSPN